MTQAAAMTRSRINHAASEMLPPMISPAFGRRKSQIRYDLETQYNDTMAQLQQAITAARLSGDAQIAEQMANYLSQVQSEYRSYMQERMAARQQSGGGTAGYSSSGSESENVDNTPPGPGVSNYNAVKNNIMLYASRGMYSVANRIIQQAWSQMSATQRNDLNATMQQNGWMV